MKVKIFGDNNDNLEIVGDIDLCYPKIFFDNNDSLNRYVFGNSKS